MEDYKKNDNYKNINNNSLTCVELPKKKRKYIKKKDKELSNKIKIEKIDTLIIFD